MSNIRFPRLSAHVVSALIVILALTLALSGCSYLIPKKNVPAPDSSPGVEKPDSIQEVTGIYVGRIDNHSVEIIVNGEEQAFRLSDELRATFDDLGLEEGQQVKITYYQNEHRQLILEELVPAEDANPAPAVGSPRSLTGKGEYVGKIDNNSIEIRVEGRAQAFWVAEELKNSPVYAALTEGSDIEFTYYLGEYQRAVITDIKVRAKQ